MTVKELQEKLAELPPDAPIFWDNSEYVSYDEAEYMELRDVIQSVGGIFNLVMEKFVSRNARVRNEIK